VRVLRVCMYTCVLCDDNSARQVRATCVCMCVFECV
jgi:hypothetical protein